MLTVAMTVYKWTEFTDNTIESVLFNKKNPIELLILMDRPWKEEIDRLWILHKKRKESYWFCNIYIQHSSWKINWLRNKAFELAKNENIFVINDDITVSENYDYYIENMIGWKIINPVFKDPNNKNRTCKENNISWHARATDKKTREKIWPIDKDLKLWFGDDYIFYNAIDHWIDIERTANISVYHFLSKTLTNGKIQEEVKKTIKNDTERRKEIIKANWRIDTRFTY